MGKTKQIIDEVKSKGIKVIIPNAFTAFRLYGAFAIPKEMANENYVKAATLAGMCGLSDAVDGNVARSLDAETLFGAKFDQVVDKAFVLGVLIPLLERDPKWALVILGEAAIAKTNIEKEMQGETVKSSLQGKLKTVFLFATIAASYLGQALDIKSPGFKKFLNGMFGASIAMEIITLIGYKDNEDKPKVLKRKTPKYIKIDTN